MLILRGSFGALDLYVVSDEYLVPRIYPSTTSALINGSTPELSQLILNDSFTLNNTAVFLSDELSSSQLEFVSNRDNLIVGIKSSKNIIARDDAIVPFNWSSFDEGIEVRYVTGWKWVVRTDGNGTLDSMSFPSIDSCPYKFTDAYNASGWMAVNSSMIYFKTGNEPLVITQVFEGLDQPIDDVVGVWWETGWVGMGTKPVQFPIIIPANEKAILQINHVITSNITLAQTDFRYQNVADYSIPSISFQQVNPTKYSMNVRDATEPFFIVFSEGYNQHWNAYISNDKVPSGGLSGYPNYNSTAVEHSIEWSPQDIAYLFANPLNTENHFKVNGYANAWYIDPHQLGVENEFTITLYYLPQSYSYLGFFVSGISIAALAGYLLIYSKLAFPIKKGLKTLLHF